MIALASLLAIVIGFGLLVAQAAVGFLRHRSRAVRTFCPGPRAATIFGRALRAMLWLRRGRCGYDLRGHVHDRAAREMPPHNAADSGESTWAAATIRCPECGRVITRYREMLHRPRIWRAAPLALALLIAGAGGVRVILHSTAVKAAFLPTDVLILIETHMDRSTPLTFHKELRRRCYGGELSERQFSSMVPLLLRDLRDDDVPNNAARAANLLLDGGTALLPVLQTALDSADWQQRYNAALILIRIDASGPSRRLLEVSLDVLCDPDRQWGRGGSFSWNSHAGQCFKYLCRYAVSATPILEAGLLCDDELRRFTCAQIAGFMNRIDLAHHATAALRVRFTDRNDFVRAKAAGAMLGFGEAALPCLRSAAESDDLTERTIARHLIDHLAPAEFHIRRWAREPLSLAIPPYYDPLDIRSRYFASPSP